MKFNNIKQFFFTLFILIFISPLLSQEDVQNQIFELVGVWENNSKIISIEADENGNISTKVILKTFYGFYYDGTYPLASEIDLNLARIGDSVYVEYWTAHNAYFPHSNGSKTEESSENFTFKVTIEKPQEFNEDGAEIAPGVLWLPNTNIQELSIDEVVIKNELLAYYIEDDSIYEIRYWLSDVNFQSTKAELVLAEGEEKSAVLIDKHIKIGDLVYTCATGLRTQIRNVHKIESLQGNAVFSGDDKVLVFGEPYLYLSNITSLEDSILTHNSIIRPPRDGKATFVEPSIYKILEQMTIEDFDNPYAPIH